MENYRNQDVLPTTPIDATPNSHSSRAAQRPARPSQERGWDLSPLLHCALLPAFLPSPPPTDSTASPAGLSDLFTSPISNFQTVAQGTITFTLPKFVLTFVPSFLFSANCCPQQSRLQVKPLDHPPAAKVSIPIYTPVRTAQVSAHDTFFQFCF